MADAASQCAWWTVRSFARDVFARLPADARLRCREVSPAWKAYLDGELALWQHVDLSDSSGVTPISDKLLRAACARAGGQLLSLDVFHARLSRPPGLRSAATVAAIRNKFRLATLLSVLQASAASLQRVRVGHLWLHYSEDLFEGWEPVLDHCLPNPADVERIARAAPSAVLEAGTACLLANDAFMREGGDDPPARIDATHDAVVAMLRREPPFSRLQLHTLHLTYFLRQRSADRRSDAEAYVAFSTHLGAHDSLERIKLYHWEGFVADAQALAALVGACIALPRLKDIELVYIPMPPQPLPQLTRLLSECSQLQRFKLTVGGYVDYGRGLDFMTGPEVGAFCDALRDSRLQRLHLQFGGRVTTDATQFADAAAGQLVMAAAQECATLREVQVNNVTHRDGVATLRQ